MHLLVKYTAAIYIVLTDGYILSKL